MTPTAIGSSLAAHQDVDAASVTSPTPEQQKAARDFEAIFLRQLLSSLEKGGGLGGESSGGQVFRSMMVSALADTASEGGGIGLSELILKAMLPPAPRGRPDLTSPAAVPSASPHAAASLERLERGEVLVGLGDGAASAAGTPALASSGSTPSRWAAPSRVLTEARRAPMLEGSGTAFAGALREGKGR